MSRIGKLPVHIPDGVEVKVENNLVSAKGPMGSESVQIREPAQISKWLVMLRLKYAQNVLLKFTKERVFVMRVNL